MPDIYTTRRLIAAVRGVNPAQSFLRDRYFPTSPASIFTTSKVNIEYAKGDRRLAPFVVDNTSPMAVSRPGRYMREYEPPTIMPERVLTAEDTKKRGFGEPLYGENVTPAERAMVITMEDFADLDRMITRREEAMASEVMRTNKCKMLSYVDEMKPTLVDEIYFYDKDKEKGNPANVTISTDWDDPSADILGDIYSMIELLITEGLPATDLIVAPDVAMNMIANKDIKEYLDLRRYELGNVAPTLIGGNGTAAVVCTLNVNGHMISVISYAETYTDDEGKAAAYMPSGEIVLTAPGAGTMLYGAVTQLEEDDGEFHTYPMARVPKRNTNSRGNIKTLSVTSMPLPAPINANPFISAKVLGN